MKAKENLCASVNAILSSFDFNSSFGIGIGIGMSISTHAAAASIKPG